MEEKILVKSERYNVGRGLCVFFIIISVLCVLFFVGAYANELAGAQADCHCDIWEYPETCTVHKYYPSPAARAWSWSRDELSLALGIAGCTGLVCFLIFAWLHSYQMTVTDKRVYGKTAFGKRVDLPVDSVSAIGSKWMNGVAVSTSSGRIAFLMIKNRDEIHNCVSKLLIERQNKLTTPSVVKQEAHMSNPEKLKKYKELLDMEVITQEEFDKKKKQLLE